MASDSPHLKTTYFARPGIQDLATASSSASAVSRQWLVIWGHWSVNWSMYVFHVQTCMECTYKGMQCKHIARLLFVNSATQAKAMPAIRPKPMPGRGIRESRTARKQHCMCCNPQMTWWVSFYCFHYLSLGSSLTMYQHQQFLDNG